MQKRFSGPGAHHGEVISLRLLTESDGMSQRDLAETLHLSRPRITSILQELERSGAVTRRPDVADQRITRVFLTPEGRRRELENRAAFEEYLRQTMGALTEADKAELTRILDELSGCISKLLCAGSRDPEGHVTL
jgi:MarR family transcriptional regulator, organic hydroperoxide resistance regulator